MSATAWSSRAARRTETRAVLNYFNYFTEIEERFQRRRGALLLLSTLDWALIETWRDAGIPLEAVLRGIDAAFDKYEARQKRGRMRRVNGLAWCAQAVMVAAEELREAAVGTAPAGSSAGESGFEQERVAVHLEAAATALDAATWLRKPARQLRYDCASWPPRCESQRRATPPLTIWRLSNVRSQCLKKSSLRR